MNTAFRVDLQQYKRLLLLIALIWTIASGFIVLKTTIFGPQSDLGLVSVKDELIAWAFSLSFIPLACWVAIQRLFKNYWLYSVLMGLVLALIYAFVWDKINFEEVVIPLNSSGSMGFITEGAEWTGTEGRFFPSTAFDMFSSCLLILGIAFTTNSLRVLKSRELNELRLKASLAKSKMSLLKAQVHPHFMFNTLNTVSGLMEEDVDKAQSVLEDFSHLLRTSLRQSDQQYVSLREELEFIRRYLSIEKIRFGDKISVKWSIDESCLDAATPHMLLQPLIENVINHSFPIYKGGELLIIRAEKQEEELRLSVEDNGRGIKPGRKEGVGLQTVRERVNMLFGSEGSFTIGGREEGGTRVQITLPFRKYENQEITLENADE
ncbi:MAG: histidine kinase [Roseivirga sp.]|nr:histidine kinase [Roseivirga sp.]